MAQGYLWQICNIDRDSLKCLSCRLVGDLMLTSKKCLSCRLVCDLVLTSKNMGFSTDWSHQRSHGIGGLNWHRKNPLYNLILCGLEATLVVCTPKVGCATHCCSWSQCWRILFVRPTATQQHLEALQAYRARGQPERATPYEIEQPYRWNWVFGFYFDVKYVMFGNTGWSSLNEKVL